MDPLTTLVKYAYLRPDHRVLDLDGNLLEYLVPYVRPESAAALTWDRERYRALASAHPGLRVRRPTRTGRLPFRDSSYDLLVSLSGHEDLDRVRAALPELSRVARRGGHWCLVSRGLPEVELRRLLPLHRFQLKDPVREHCGGELVLAVRF